MALLLTTSAAAPGVSSQATDEHPVVGAWLIDPSPEDATDPLELLTVAPGGIITIAGRMAAATLPAEGPAPGGSADLDASATTPSGEARVIDIVATAEPRFTDPSGTQITDIPVAPGATITLRVENTAGFPHNFYIGSDEELAVLSGTTDTGIPTIESGIQELTWVVSDDITGLMYGCTFPGRYKMMQGTSSVSA